MTTHPYLSESVTSEDLKDRTNFHVRYSRGRDDISATNYDKFMSFSHAVRDLAVDRFLKTQRTYVEQDVKRVYYLSMEFLIGKLLQSNILGLGIVDQARDALSDMGIHLEDMFEQDIEAGLGNGGLGRLAACFMDSLASLEYPAYGYGLRYEYGIFRQEFEDGWQQETPDDWLALGYPWEIVRPEHSLPVRVYGRTRKVPSDQGGQKTVWTDWQMFEGVPYDIPIIGYGVNTVNMLRLWSSRAAKEFHLDVFNTGDYVGAVEDKNWAENVSKVLYPSDETYAGKELRLIQEYFLVACTIRDLTRRYRVNHKEWDNFPLKNAIQMNDTHPALAVAELMRYFCDEIGLPWDKAWEITTDTFAYTNHTLLPEALEKWSVELLQKVLPRHTEIIYKINDRFLQKMEVTRKDNLERARKMAIIESADTEMARMAHLAIIGSHKVNGVSALHSELLRDRVVPEFSAMYPDKFCNITNGITHRRWLLQCNPRLSSLITNTVGEGWTRDLEQLQALEEHSKDTTFQEAFLKVKRENKQDLSRIIEDLSDVVVHPDSMYDVQIKRLHMYKRQLLNAMHVILLYLRIKRDPGVELTPRTFIFGAKAAPSYDLAKQVIKLINTVAARVNCDPDVEGRLKVVFLPDYNVSLAERIIPAADLSEQISTAGMEASGTGNMKLALNGALTIGTWDGANIEIAEAVGEENIFEFGLRENELVRLRDEGYDPRKLYEEDEDLRSVVDAIKTNIFDPRNPECFTPIYEHLIDHGDPFFYLADFASYIACQRVASDLYNDQHAWAEKAILNVARMGWFSSDRTIREYAMNIWNIEPVHIDS